MLRRLKTFFLEQGQRPFLLLGLALVLRVLDSTDPMIRDILGYGLLLPGLLTVGLAHGAVDQLTHSRSQQLPLLIFIARYLAWMAGMLLLWWWLPSLALGLFLLYSAYHFGEADLQEWQVHSPPLALIWGITVLGMLLSSHPQELAPIWTSLTGATLPQWNWLWIAGGLGLVALTLSLVYRRPAWTIVLLTVVVSYGLPLLMAFGLYFVGQHSINGWKHLHQGLEMSHFRLALKAAPYTLGAWLFLAAALAWASTSPEWEHYAAAFFIFLSCLSLPHVWHMGHFYRHFRLPGS